MVSYRIEFTHKNGMTQVLILVVMEDGLVRRNGNIRHSAMSAS